jgi:hypothetical protein
MRILLDECIDECLRHLFTEYDCQTARYAGFAGLTNGALLLAGKSAAFDVLMTVDQNIPDQQTLTDLGAHPLWSHQSLPTDARRLKIRRFSRIRTLSASLVI